jgi:hypothetical protein
MRLLLMFQNLRRVATKMVKFSYLDKISDGRGADENVEFCRYFFHLCRPVADGIY